MLDHASQLAATGTEREVVLRAASGPEVGMRHAMRCRAIAQALRDAGVSPLVVVDDRATARALEGLGVPARPAADDPGWVSRPLAGAWLDGHRDWSAEVRALAGSDTVAWLAENRSRARESAAGVVYPALHWVPDAWDADHPERVRGGSSWIPLAREVRELAPVPTPDVDLVVTFGGSDPRGLTERALGALARVGWSGRTLVVLGPHMAGRRTALTAAAAALPRGGAVDGAVGIAPLLARARVVLTAAGTTLNELAHLGVSAAILANEPGDAVALEHHRERGPHVPIGVAPALSDEELDAALPDALEEASRRPRTALTELAGGAGRIAALLLDGRPASDARMP